jgi:hypothetical protein
MCQNSSMGWMSWLLIVLAVLLIISSARVHFLPGQFGDHVSIDFVAPWR